MKKIFPIILMALLLYSLNSFALSNSTATGLVSLPEAGKEINIVQKTAALHKAAILLISTRITGDVSYPSFEMIFTGAMEDSVVGTWQIQDETVTFTAEGTFSGNSTDLGNFSGTYSTQGNNMTLNYLVPPAGIVQFTYLISGDSMTLSHPEFGTYTYTRVSGSEPEIQSIVDVAKNMEFVRETGPAAKIETTPVEAGFHGSGFIVNPNGYIITNAHVVLFSEEEAENELINVYFALIQQGMVEEFSAYYEMSEAEKQEVVEIMLNKLVNYILSNGSINNVQVNSYALNGVAKAGEDITINSWPVEIKKAGEVNKVISGEVTWGRDVAVLKVNKTNLPTVKLGDSSKVETGDQAFVIGYPGIAESNMFIPSAKLEATVTTGVISGKKQLKTGLEVLQTEAAIHGGNSGGPVFNDKGEVIGIATFGPKEVGVDFLMPINLAKEFLNELNVENEQGPINEHYRTGLEAFWARDCVNANASLQKVLGIYPGHPYVQEYITECDRAIEAGEVSSTSFDPLWIGAIAVIAIIAGAAYFLVIKKKPAIPAPQTAPQAKPVTPTEKKLASKAVVKPNFCPKCGNDIELGEKFCEKCGKKL